MAVSGKRWSDFPRSTDVSSAEDFDSTCQPCLNNGAYIEAHGFCLDCREYLCNTCLKKHKRTKASKNHRLFHKDDIDENGKPKTHSEMCTEKCSIHKDEVIVCFCPHHEELACHVCVDLKHRTCDLDHINDKCADIGDSEEFRRTEWLLSKGMAEVNSVKQKATKRRKEIDTHHEDLIKSIDKYQKKINNRIQQIRNEIKKEIDKKDSLNKQTVQRVLDSCTTISSDISKLKKKLQESKTKKQNVQLYITIKQTMSKIKADEIKKSKKELDKTNLQNRFEPNPDLQALLSKQEGFGKLRKVTPLKNQVKLSEEGDINIQTELDEFPCNITGCAVLSPNKIVLADCNNNKLKVLDTKSNLVVEEKEFDSSPLDITTLPQDQIAVTLLHQDHILVMASHDKLSIIDRIYVRGPCIGISYCYDYLFTVCRDPNRVVVLNTKGKVHKTILLDIGQLPYNIVVNEGSRLMYVKSGESIVGITLEGMGLDELNDCFGSVFAVNKDLQQPAGITLLDDGSLLVCCTTGSIYHISEDLKQSQDIKSGLHKPCSICYNHNKVYIGGHEGDKLKVFSLKGF